MPIVILIVVAIIGFFLFLKLRKSNVVDNLTKDIWYDGEPKPGKVIKKIDEAEQALKNRAVQFGKDAKKLRRDEEAITDYLKDKGVVKTDEGKEK